ncbi:hypothetical protein E2C01_013888 [Portunus trituberculatus]|uniref:Uncharacterized protein n=1 Tax=Portunus trituberculatus TaxID=210409 RepID=A0A5B7DI85_PORTR|nr:hypothetical protein [Portunus trituberculatus]
MITIASLPLDSLHLPLGSHTTPIYLHPTTSHIRLEGVYGGVECERLGSLTQTDKLKLSYASKVDLISRQNWEGKITEQLDIRY